MCFNWKVIGGLAVVGLGIWLLVPSVAAAALPLLLAAACPLSMLLMMRGMQGGRCNAQAQPTQPLQASQATGVQLTPEEQLAELKAERTLVETRQRAIAREIAELEAAGTPALREAEAVARAADKRAPDHA